MNFIPFHIAEWMLVIFSGVIFLMGFFVGLYVGQKVKRDEVD